MATLLIEPHLDDAVLFASYTLLREQPVVVTVCSEARVQERYGIDALTRRVESGHALRRLGYADDYAWKMLGMSDVLLDSARLERELRAGSAPERVWVPLPEDGGHEDHEVVAAAALEAFGRARLSYYATYRRGSGRTRTDTEVIPEPDWPARKFAAMACYRSQINLENCRPWFAADDCLREWVVT